MTLVLSSRLIYYSAETYVRRMSDMKNVRNLSDVALPSIIEFIGLQPDKEIRMILGDSSDL